MPCRAVLCRPALSPHRAELLDHLFGLSPSGIHLALGDLGPLAGGDPQEARPLAAVQCSAVQCRTAQPSLGGAVIGSEHPRTSLHGCPSPPCPQVAEMLRFFLHHVRRRERADFLQALLHVFLQQHADTLMDAASAPGLGAALQELHAAVARDADLVDGTLNQAICFLKFLTHLQME